MLSLFPASSAIICGVMGYISYKERNKLNDKKAEFLSTIVPSDTMNPDNVPQGKQFILSHTVPNGDMYKIIQITIEKYVTRTIRTATPYTSTHTNYDVVDMYGIPLVIPRQTRYVSPDVMVIHEKEVNETQMKEVALHTVSPDFGLTFCGNPFGYSGIMPRLVIDQFSYFPFKQHNGSSWTFPYKKEIGDYGSVRDALKQYNCNLTLNNVGKVYATIADCAGQTLYFNAERNGTKLLYHCIATSPRAIAGDKFDKLIEKHTETFVMGIVGCIVSSIAACLAMKQ